MSVIFTMLGISLILIGIVTVFLPLPIGLICLVLGIALLVMSNAQVRKGLHWARKKFGKVDAVFDRAQEILPEKLARPMRSTDPHEDEDEEDEEDDTCPVPAKRKHMVEPVIGSTLSKKPVYLKQRPYRSRPR